MILCVIIGVGRSLKNTSFSLITLSIRNFDPVDSLQERVKIRTLANWVPKDIMTLL